MERKERLREGEIKKRILKDSKGKIKTEVGWNTNIHTHFCLS
jgi:hypothetical protein